MRAACNDPAYIHYMLPVFDARLVIKNGGIVKKPP